MTVTAIERVFLRPLPPSARTLINSGQLPGEEWPCGGAPGTMLLHTPELPLGISY